ncbi:PfkB family carbohydrate kinase [Saccharopolyspora phatthalungensis]|uniref:Sugar/nucleoside kinase (Ribokinase family) n=1 Tax=Saccharopolyspora phatthalungensis TaxID=664693 RepID=A0A840QH23_9PSEU|nr:PfkB family carbohydrate kinase [Saccharopolyspora phatthalungensis]MBB5158068.1 sugar/nucleoside kinase (ribokinase family) [Saccharopolyspora phatthalungensis]
MAAPPPRGVFVGLTTLDVVHHVDVRPAADQKTTASAQFVAAGGPAANAAVTFAGLGGAAVLVTAIGRGALGTVIRADLESHSVTIVDAAADRTTDAPVSAVAVTRSTGERSVIGIDTTALQVHRAPELAEHIDFADVVLLDGHHPVLAEAAANAASAPIVVDAGRWKPTMRPLLPRAEAVIASADFRVPGTTNSEETALALLDQDIPTVITTHGSGPVRWWHGSEFATVSPPRVQAVDTLGAGDVFHGAYCYFACQPGSDVPTSIERAAAVAALKCEIPGPRAWLHRLPDLASPRR